MNENHHTLGVYKKTPKPTRRPTNYDVHWAAGFLDGEGCFSKTKSTNRIGAAQVQREPLDKLQRLFGGRVWLRNTGAKEAHPIHEWQVNGARARGIMMTIYSLLSSRRKEQVKYALGIS